VSSLVFPPGQTEQSVKDSNAPREYYLATTAEVVHYKIRMNEREIRERMLNQSSRCTHQAAAASVAATLLPSPLLRIATDSTSDVDLMNNDATIPIT
jgi:hypothetical protein